MNKKLRLLVIAYAVSSVLSLSAVVTQDTQNSFANQQTILEYSLERYEYFLKNIFTRPDYPQERLALNFEDVIQSLSFASQHAHPRRWINQTLDLFSQNLHGVYVNADAWRIFQQALVSHVSRYTDAEAEKARTIAAYKDTIGIFLTDHFDRLLDEPESALDDLATIIYETKNADLSIRELQHTVRRFLDLGLSQLTWSPELQEEAWHIMIDIGKSLDLCTEYNLIDEHMHEDLAWSLDRSYGEFLDMAGDELKPSFFNIAWRSLKSSNNSLWCLPEKEKYLPTKYEYFMRALKLAEKNAIAATASTHLIDAGYHQ